MKVARYTQPARADLLGIHDFIAKDSPRAAARIVAQIRKRCSNLAKFPFSAEAHPEYGPETRFCTFENYVIAYRPIVTGIEVLRVVHGARDLDAIL